jgi:hypothetical protein
MTGYVLLGMALVWVIRALFRSNAAKRNMKGQALTRSRKDTPLMINPKTGRWIL